MLVNDARVQSFFHLEHIVLVDQPALDLQHLTGLHGQLHQALIAGPELRHVLLQAVVPHLQDVGLTHALVEAQAQFCGAQACLQERAAVALQQVHVVRHSGDDDALELIDGHGLREQAAQVALAHGEFLLEPIHRLGGKVTCLHCSVPLQDLQS